MFSEVCNISRGLLRFFNKNLVALNILILVEIVDLYRGRHYAASVHLFS